MSTSVYSAGEVDLAIESLASRIGAVPTQAAFDALVARVAALEAKLAAPAPAPAPTPAPTLPPVPSTVALKDVLGCYPGYSDLNSLNALEAALGTKVKTIVQFADQNTANSPGSAWGIFQGDGGAYKAPLMTRQECRMVFSVPLAFQSVWNTANQATLEQVAAGSVDGVYRTLFTYLAKWSGPKVVRLGWEHNGDWYPWSSLGRESQYVAAFRHVVDVARSVIPGVKFDWNSAVMPPNMASYPGDAYVDIISWDVYNRGTGHDPAKRKADFKTLTDLATAHGKQWALPEWGLASENGDDPSFITDTADALRAAPNCAYICEYNGMNGESNGPGSNATSGGLTPYPKAMGTLISRLNG